MRPPVMLIADDPALDFLNTTGAPRGAMIEWLESGADLVDWLRRTGLVPENMPLPAYDFTALNLAAAEARRLREMLRDHMETPTETLPAALNAIFARERSQWRLEPGPLPELWRKPSYDHPSQLLVPIAHSIAELLCTPEPDRIRQCDGPTCTMWFRDISRNNRRRWCSMAVCGNRAKAAAHRAKAKGD